MNKIFNMTAVLMALGMVFFSTAQAQTKGTPPVTKTMEMKCGSTKNLFDILNVGGKIIAGARQSTGTKAEKDDPVITLWLMKSGQLIIVTTKLSGESCVVLRGYEVTIPTGDDSEDESNG